MAPLHRRLAVDPGSVPDLRDRDGVVLEAPVILAISWVTCAWCVDRFRVPSGAWIRLLMGAAAFSLLGVAEISISLFVFAGRLRAILQDTGRAPALSAWSPKSCSPSFRSLSVQIEGYVGPQNGQPRCLKKGARASQLSLVCPRLIRRRTTLRAVRPRFSTRAPELSEPSDVSASARPLYRMRRVSQPCH